MYSFCAYGQEGVEKAFQIFRVSRPRNDTINSN
jgi:hypothetical protein